MNTKLGIWLGGIALVVSVLAFARPLPAPIEKVVQTLGAAAGPYHTEKQFFAGGYEWNCKRYATSSTAATYTLVNAELGGDNCYLDWTVNVNTTVTTMASTSEPFVSMKKGDMRQWYVRNASTTAAASMTIAAGTGVDLQKNEDTADLAILGLDVARFTALKKNDTDILLIMEEWIEAD